jgi:hypothetical protein
MFLSDREIEECVSVLEGKKGLPDDVRDASVNTLVYLTEFMREYGGWSNFQMPADEMLWFFLCTDPFSQFAYLVTYPQYAFPLGYDEFLWATPESIYGKEYFANADPKYREFAERFANLPLPHFRRADSGVWDFLYPDTGFVGISREKELPIGREYGLLIQKLRKYNTLIQPTSIIRPELWTLRSQEQIMALVEPVQAILRSLYNENEELSAIHWRTLEEIVAELLRAKGLSIHVTPRSADGGRDIIARGELVPGEPTTLAVEVKHKTVVPVSDLRAALWANRNFPLLLLATSGRFSAGIVREKSAPEVESRVILKDGVALKQWIDAYGRGLSWPKPKQLHPQED